MRFHFLFLPKDRVVRVYYKSSKEEVILGHLTFKDSDGDEREDIAKLLKVVIEDTDNPMLKVETVK